MSYEPLHHKYRPQTFAELVGQEAIATTLTHAILATKIAPAYLFTGPRGTGKTSSARILAKSLNCLKENQPTAQPCGVCHVCHGITKGSTLDVIEIDAASNTGVDNIREMIERAQFAPVQCRYKIYIIDEVHMLSTAAFNALLKTLEEPPAQVVFVLATTDPQRVLPTIISRCQRFDFRRIPLEAMVAHLQAIAAQEKINITAEAVQLVSQVAQGGLRDAESLLDQLSLLSGEVTVERVWDLIGAVSEPDLVQLLQAIAHNHPESLLDCARSIMERGKEPLTLLQNLAGFYRDLLIAKTAPQRNDLVAVTPSTWKALCEQATNWDISSILVGQQHLAKSEVQIKNTTQPRLWLEVTLLGLLPAANSGVSVSPSQQGSQLQTPNISNPSLPQPQLTHKDNVAQTQSAPALVIDSQVEVPVLMANLPPSEQQEQPIFTPEPELAGEINSSSSPDAESTAEINSSSSTSLPQVTTNSAVETSKEQVWQQVLANLQPMSTRELLRQMGHLIEFDGTVARIGMRSLALCNRAKAYLPNITAAFGQTFQQEVVVKLELATSLPTQTNSVQKPSLTPKISAPTTSPSIPQPTAVEVATTATERLQVTTEIHSEIAVRESTAPQIAAPPITTEWDIDEVAIAAQRLADFFKGEIVKMGDDPTLAQTTEDASLTAATTPEWYDADAEDADIDF